MAIGITSLFRCIAKKGFKTFDKAADKFLATDYGKRWTKGVSNPDFLEFQSKCDWLFGHAFNQYI